MAKSIECKCGNIIYVTDEVCPYCGAIKDVTIDNYLQTRNYYPNGKRVNKGAYILVAILLGGLGFHKFYAGKISAGIIYLIFCWTLVPAVIGIIEGLLAIGKPADETGNIYFLN